LLGVVYGVVKRQYDYAAILMFTWFASSAYHQARESQFYNLDFLFACSQGIFFVWTLFLSTPTEYWDVLLFRDEALAPLAAPPQLSHCAPSEDLFLLGVLAFPMAVLLFFMCGQPADIVSLDKERSCFCRRDSVLYNLVHPLWHLWSGLGPFWMIQFYSTFCDSAPNVTMGAEDVLVPLGLFQLRVPTVIFAALAVSITVSWLGNRTGIMPPW